MNGRGVRSGTQMIATHGYNKKPDSPMGKGIH